MSKKTLLNETQIRRFMKLSGQQALGDTYMQRNGQYLQEQAGMEDEDLDPVGDDGGLPGEMPAPEAGPDDAMGMDEPPLDAGMEMGEEGTISLEPQEIEVLITKIVDGVMSAAGIDGSASVTMGEEAPDMADAGDMGMEDDDMGMEPMGDDMAMEDDEVAPANVYESRLKNFIKSEVIRLMQEEAVSEGQHMPDGENEDVLIGKGTNSNRDFEKDDNRQSSAGQHHMGGGAAKASRTHMGGNNAALPLQETLTDELLERVTRRVAARLLNTRTQRTRRR